MHFRPKSISKYWVNLVSFFTGFIFRVKKKFVGTICILRTNGAKLCKIGTELWIRFDFIFQNGHDMDGSGNHVRRRTTSDGYLWREEATKIVGIKIIKFRFLKIFYILICKIDRRIRWKSRKNFTDPPRFPMSIKAQKFPKL